MSACHRFDGEFLSEWEESGVVRDEHVRTCCECRERLRAYQRLSGAIRFDTAPAQSEGWEKMVLTAIRTGERARPLEAIGESTMAAESKSRRALSLYVGLAGLVAAAGFSLFVVRKTTTPNLPDYVALVEGGERRVRGGDAGGFFRSGDAAHVLLRPDRAVEGEVAAKAFIVAGHSMAEVPISLTPLGKGVVRLTWITLGDKPVNIAVVVGRRESIGQSPEAIVMGSHDKGAGWQRLTFTLDIEPPSP